MFNLEGLDLQSTCRAPGVCPGGAETGTDSGHQLSQRWKLPVRGLQPQPVWPVPLPWCPLLGAEDPVPRQVPWQVAGRRKEKHWSPTGSLQGYIMNPQAVSLIQQRDHERHWRQREYIHVAEVGRGYRNIMKQLYHHRKCLCKLCMWRSMFVYFLKD